MKRKSFLIFDFLAFDPFGDHALIGMTTGDVVHRHNDLHRHFVAEGRPNIF